jgi:maltose alpha-D-glucosyltransferase / alpha-amylase
MASKTPPSERSAQHPTPSAEALGAWLPTQRWFAAKTRRITDLDVEDRVPIGDADLVVVALGLDDGTRHRYAVPLAQSLTPRDALADPSCARALLDLVRQRGSTRGRRGTVRGVPTSALPSPRPDDLAVRRASGEQSNASVTFGDALILKQFRRLQDGVNPDAEITRYLTEHTDFRATPRLAGQLDYEWDGRVSTLAVVQELVSGARDGWQWMLRELEAFHARAGAAGRDATAVAVRALADESLTALRQLGRRTAELHVALGAPTSDPAFAPEPITLTDVTDWIEAVQAQIARARVAAGDATLGADARSLALGLGGLLGRVKSRHHGDFHLGQTLYRPGARDWSIIDFEGEPLRPLDERRRKHAVVRDVAGMLRSLAYAAMSVRGDADGHEAWATTWEIEARAAFLDGYRTVAAGAAFMPIGDEAFARAVAAFELEKAAYEIVYEANNRPDWIGIPVRGFVRAAAALARRPGAGAA